MVELGKETGYNESVDTFASRVEKTQDYFNDLSLKFRQRYWGRMRLRPGLPWVDPDAPARLREQCFYDLVFSRAFSPDEALSQAHVLDIGCRNWSYLRSFTRSFPNARLQGIEIDSYRRYWNLFRRLDYANAYVQRLATQSQKIEVFAEDFLDFNWREPPGGRAPLFCFFFPFVSQNPCRKWGLPARYADFGALIEHALGLSRSCGQGGALLSVHQGEWEGVLARAIYLEHGVEIISENVISASEFRDFWPSPHDAWVIRARGTTPR